MYIYNIMNISACQDELGKRTKFYVEVEMHIVYNCIFYMSTVVQRGTTSGGWGGGKGVYK